jgi:nicotinamidase-related amidase
MADTTTIRDPNNDHLLTPTNAAVTFIDYQPEQFAGVHSMDRDELLINVTLLGRVATAFRLPVVLSTVYVSHGMSGTNQELVEALPGVAEIDRTTMNSWEDPDFRAAIDRTNRKALIIAGLWTEVCVAFPALDALREGFRVYFVADATPISVLALACELQRDWGRPGADRLRAIMREYFTLHSALRKSRAQ